jgi:hypothetical protein
MALNREWHATHRLARNATLQQRLDWHLAHAAACGCRVMPESIRQELAARGLTNMLDQAAAKVSATPLMQ